MSFNGKGYGQVIVVVILVALVIAFTLFLRVSFPQKKEQIKIHRFEVQPPEFKVSETGELLLEVENIENDFTTITAHFETHKNVELYRGAIPLARSSGNFTFNKSLDPKEKTELRFTIEASLDVGDNLRNYYIKAYIYVNGKLFGIEQDTFIVRGS